MVRKSFLLLIGTATLFLIGLMLIAHLFDSDKTWLNLTWAALGLTLLPIAITIRLKFSSVIPLHKVIILTGVWVAWVMLAAISAQASYTYWQDHDYSYEGGCFNGLCSTLD